MPNYERVFSNKEKYVLFNIETREKKYYSKKQDAMKDIGITKNSVYKYILGGKYLLKETATFVEPTDEEIRDLVNKAQRHVPRKKV